MIDIKHFKDRYKDIECCRTSDNTVFILCGGLDQDDAWSYLTDAAQYLMGDTPYNHYVEEYLDNPWIRVLITSKDGFSVEERKGYVVFHRDLPTREGSFERCEMSILVGGLGRVNPNSYMNAMVDDFIRTTGHNTFIDSTQKNPWVRVIITGINELLYEQEC